VNRAVARTAWLGRLPLRISLLLVRAKARGTPIRRGSIARPAFHYASIPFDFVAASAGFRFLTGARYSLWSVFPPSTLDTGPTFLCRSTAGRYARCPECSHLPVPCR